MTVQEVRNTLEQRKGQRLQIGKSIFSLKKKLKKSNKYLERVEQAREIIKIVGLNTQQQLQFHVADIVSLALENVFTNPYKLVLDFVKRRNKTECDILFERDGERVDPIDATGGGVIDVAAFALRIASWSMERPRTRNTIILDEPFKHLKGVEANKKVLQIVKQISEKLNVQIIMVSDERINRNDIIDAADKVFEIKIKNGISIIK